MKIKFRKTILVIIILINLISVVNAITVYDTDWTHKEDIILEWGDSHSTGNYAILAEDFDKKAVQLIVTLYKNNDKIQTALMSAGDTIEVSTIKITVNEIGGWTGETGIPYARMTIYTMKPPAITLNIENNINPNGLMNLTFNIENSGGIRFSTIILKVTIPEDFIISSNKYQNSFDSMSSLHNGSIITSTMENLSAGSIETQWVNMEIPALPEEMEVPIHLDASGYDLENRYYEISNDANIIVEPAIKVNKVPLHAMINNSDDLFHMNDRVYVYITVFNSATTDAYDVTLNENLVTSNFVLDPDSQLDWTFDLPARKSESFYYYMRPIRPGEVQISVTKVSREYKGHIYLNTIDSTTVKIDGSYFEISKTLDNYKITPDEKITVTVVAENTGNHASYLILSDEIPEYAQFIEGTLSTSGVVKPGDKLSISYGVNINKIGEFRFPSATGQYKEQHYEGIVYSTRPLFHVLVPTPAIVEPIDTIDHTNDIDNSGNTENNSIPGFGFSIATSFGILMYLLSKKKW